MGNTLQRSSPKLSTNHEEEHIETENEKGGSPFTCEICIEPMSSNMKFKNDDKCVHPFCMECMAMYIQVKVEDEAAAKVECPGLNCKQLLDPISCRHLITQKVFDKWCDNLCESAILGADKCYCPYQDCSALVVIECEGVFKRSECPNCKKFFCFRCKIPWHAGYRCEESGEVRDANDILFGQLVESKNWIRCPECGHMVERILGCNDVLCRCKTSFCYKCGKKRSDHDGGRLCGVPPPVTFATEQNIDEHPGRLIQDVRRTENIENRIKAWCVRVILWIVSLGYICFIVSLFIFQPKGGST